MSTAAAISSELPLWSRASGFERAMVMIGAMMATFMQVLDTTIANVALPHMQTSLGATSETVTWVLTSYLVASAIAIPITGWLADKVGRKELFIVATIAFTGASALCAIATNLPEMVLFRIVQGIAGAFIVPLGQAIMLDINPPDKSAKAMMIFGLGTLIGPVVGPLLGGFLTENFNWRWVFLVNVPFGIACALIVLRYLPQSDRTERRFDLFGFALLALALGAMQMLLDRGQQLDWFDSWEVWIETGLMLGAGWMFMIHLFTVREPLFDPAMFADRNYTMTLIFSMVLGMVILAGAALLPSLLQRLLGLSVFQSGVLVTPRAIGSLVAIAVAGRLNNRLDVRAMVFLGTSIMIASLWGMTGFTLDMDMRLVYITGFAQGFGMGLCFVPITILGFATIATHLRTSAASIMTLARSIGGSIGISIATTILARNMQTSHSDLAAHITTEKLPIVDPSVIGAAGSGGETAMAMIDAEITRQAAMVAYIDVFHVMMIASLVSLPLALLLKKPDDKRAAERPMVAE